MNATTTAQICCEQCQSTNNVSNYWWNETANEKWVLCEECGINEEQEKCNDETKNCGHKYECGCDKTYCEDCLVAIENDELGDCDAECCKQYYTYRNDNCNCDGWDCGFCNPQSDDDEFPDEHFRCDRCKAVKHEDYYISISNDPSGNTICDVCIKDYVKERGIIEDSDEDE